MAFTQDFRTQRRNYNDGESRIGEKDRLWYDSNTNSIRISDGETPGGIAVGGSGGGGDYTLPTASTTVKGGVKVDGTTITISNQVISGFSGSYNDLSNKPTLFDGAYDSLSGKPTLFSGSYADLTNKPTLFSGSYNDLSNKPTLFSGSYTDLSNKPTIYASAYIGTTSLDFTRSSGSQTLSGVSISGNAGTVTNGVYTTDTGTVTNTMLAGNIANAKLLNSTATIGSTVVALGATVSSLAGLNSVTANNFIGNATTVTNGVYTNSIGVVTDIMLAGSIANNKLANSSITVNGTSISLGSSATITAANPNALTIGTGLSGTSYTGGSAVTIAIDSTVATLTGSQTLTNKTLTLSGNLTFSDATVQSTAWLGSTDRVIKVAGSFAADQPFKSEVISDLTNGVSISTWMGLPAFATEKTWQFAYNGNMTFPDGTNQITAYTGNAATVTNGVYTTDTGTVTNTMLAGSIANDKLANSSITINGSATALGGSVTISTITGNAGTATKLATARAINGVDFDGSAAITVTAAAGTLTGTTLNSTVVTSSLTSVGTLTSLAVTNSSSSPVTITYTPATTTGVGIISTGKDTQGGTGYYDFFRATNTTSGVTNGSKTFRLTSTGSIEIINSAYNANLFTLTDTGGLSVSGPISVSGKQAVNGPAFRAYVSVGQTITSGSQQKVTFGTENFDTASCFATSTFTPNIEGYYQFNATVRISGGASTGEYMLVLYKNGGEYARGHNGSGTEIGASFYSLQVSDIAYANGSTDNFDIRIQQTSGSDKTTTAGSTISYFSGCMIRGA